MLATTRVVIGDLREWGVRNDDLLRKAGNVLAVGLPLLFLAIGLVQAAPYVDDVPVGSKEMDDWAAYKLLAHSVLVGGPAMPDIGAYGAQPGTVHGFIYIYFLAGVFAIFGENTAYAYVVQSLLLGASASILYLAWRRHLSPLAAVCLLIGGAALIFLDIYRSIGFRLLSENLFIFLMVGALLLLFEAHRRAHPAMAILCGVALGLAVLSRTSFLIASIAIVAMSAAYAWRRSVPWSVPASILLGFAIGMSPLPIREFAATGQPDLYLLAPKPSDLYPVPTESVQDFAGHYLRRVLFVVGFTTTQEPDYRWRPHWMILWASFAAYAVWRLRRPDFSIRDISVLLILVLYLGPVVAFSYPSNYGARMISVILPLVLALGVQFVDKTVLRSVTADWTDSTAVRPGRT